MAEVGSVKSGSVEWCVDARLRLSEHAHHVRMDDQVIVADMRSGHYFGLDGIAARMWELIGKHSLSPEAVVGRLHSEYEVSTDVLEARYRTNCFEICFSEALSRRSRTILLPRYHGRDVESRPQVEQTIATGNDAAVDYYIMCQAVVTRAEALPAI